MPNVENKFLGILGAEAIELTKEEKADIEDDENRKKMIRLAILEELEENNYNKDITDNLTLEKQQVILKRYCEISGEKYSDLMGAEECSKYLEEINSVYKRIYAEKQLEINVEKLKFSIIDSIKVKTSGNTSLNVNFLKEDIASYSNKCWYDKNINVYKDESLKKVEEALREVVASDVFWDEMEKKFGKYVYKVRINGVLVYSRKRKGSGPDTSSPGGQDGKMAASNPKDMEDSPLAR